jgi:hypothetical protein
LEEEIEKYRPVESAAAEFGDQARLYRLSRLCVVAALDREAAYLGVTRQVPKVAEELAT